jgi:signal transduction histidine kinase
MTPGAPVRTIVAMKRPAGLRRPMVISLIGVAVVITVIIVGTSHVEREGTERAANAGAYVLGIGAALSLLLWRRRPLVMIGVVAAALFTYLAAAYPPGPVLMTGPISLVLLGIRVPRVQALLGAAVMACAVIAGSLIGDARAGIVIAAAGWSLAAVFAGELGGARRERVHAERERRRMAERQAITDERLRIAQDLHDSVAHAMATINVQAGAASHLLHRQPDRLDPQQIHTALDAIRSASSEVLDELGAILGLLRRDPERGEQAAPRQPQHGVDRLGDLVERARADGIAVTLDVSSSLPAPISTTAYRVVQEALSNVRQHAGAGASVTVTVAAGDDGVTVSVIDDGGRVPARVAARATPGFGLVGMRERVESTGGTLIAGPTHSGGFSVVARWGSP